MGAACCFPRLLSLLPQAGFQGLLARWFKPKAPCFTPTAELWDYDLVKPLLVQKVLPGNFTECSLLLPYSQKD